MKQVGVTISVASFSDLPTDQFFNHFNCYTTSGKKKSNE